MEDENDEMGGLEGIDEWDIIMWAHSVPIDEESSRKKQEWLLWGAK